MKIKTVVVGSLKTNCYFLINDNKCLIIDPGEDVSNIIREDNLEVCGILITHHHSDHDKFAKELSFLYKALVYDFNNLFEGSTELDGFKFKTIYTPGHSFDSVIFHFFDEDVLFTGDFIFKGSIGRTDLESGDYKEMLNSIKKFKSLGLDPNTIIYPGHYDKTTLAYELMYNMYL